MEGLSVSTCETSLRAHRNLAFRVFEGIRACEICVVTVKVTH